MNDDERPFDITRLITGGALHRPPSRDAAWSGILARRAHARARQRQMVYGGVLAVMLLAAAAIQSRQFLRRERELRSASSDRPGSRESIRVIDASLQSLRGLSAGEDAERVRAETAFLLDIRGRVIADSTARTGGSE
ncbi:MAG: hypothetical protein V4550_18965 [Gemmatimonadota bacterium]